MNQTIESANQNELLALLRGVVALLAADREDRLSGSDSLRRAEVILASAGLSISEIAQVTGKKYDTVKTTLRRTRSKKGSAGEPG